MLAQTPPTTEPAPARRAGLRHSHACACGQVVPTVWQESGARLAAQFAEPAPDCLPSPIPPCRQRKPVSQQVAECGKVHWSVWRCQADRQTLRKLAVHCHSRFCKVCAKVRAGRWYHKFRGSEFTYWPRLVGLTLERQQDLAAGVALLLRSLAKLRRRQPYKSEWRGAVMGIELLPKPDGWHIHLHLLVDATNYIHKQTLSDNWRDVTGGSIIVDVRDVTADADGHYLSSVREVVKYSTKEYDNLTAAQVDAMAAATKSRRLVECWGTVRKALAGHRAADKAAAAVLSTRLDTKETSLHAPKCPCHGLPMVYQGRWRQDTPLDVPDYTPEDRKRAAARAGPPQVAAVA